MPSSASARPRLEGSGPAGATAGWPKASPTVLPEGHVSRYYGVAAGLAVRSASFVDSSARCGRPLRGGRHARGPVRDRSPPAVGRLPGPRHPRRRPVSVGTFPPAAKPSPRSPWATRADHRATTRKRDRAIPELEVLPALGDRPLELSAADVQAWVNERRGTWRRLPCGATTSCSPGSSAPRDVRRLRRQVSLGSANKGACPCLLDRPVHRRAGHADQLCELAQL